MKKQPTNNVNKEAYRQLCEREEMPLFMQYWWLEGVSAGKDWDVIVVERDGKIVAAMPYEHDKRLWRRYVREPELTPYAGIWLAPEVRDNQAEMEAICREVDRQLSERRIGAFHQRFPVDSPLPNILTGIGYRLIARRTYLMNEVSDPEKVLDGFSKNKRKKLDKIRSSYTVKDLDPEEFYRFHVLTSAQKNIRIWYTRETLLVIWEKCRLHGQARCVGVYGEHDELLAAALLVWDTDTLYQLLNTFDHDTPDNGARELLTFEAIRQAATLGKKVDFTFHRDYLKHYGAEKHTFYSVHKGAMPMVALQRIINWFTTD